MWRRQGVDVLLPPLWQTPPAVAGPLSRHVAPDARDAWRAARLAVSKGESPAHIRPTTADSFAAVADEWLKRDQVQNRSAAEVRRVIERDINPAWGDRLIAAITRRDAIELIDRIADRGALTMAAPCPLAPAPPVPLVGRPRDH